MVAIALCCLVRQQLQVYRKKLLCCFFLNFRHGHHRIVELLLRSKRFSVNAVDNSHMSPLHLAAIGGRSEVIRILLECPDINVVRDRDFLLFLSLSLSLSRCFSMRKIKMEKQH